ncbi:hypothetical protein L1987_08544 [Smallanthus sonchifolius]|uniref:Uncharacterized protein n=1 Tax=Smallanthus sonchifolius TaxID=185202 RepID=A0ACB9JKG4_9ASTR|nr:hypothetical protein L1987_08544 [Smallanthus sonchifolius]
MVHRRARSPDQIELSDEEADVPEIQENHRFLQFPQQTQAWIRLQRYLHKKIRVARTIPWDFFDMIRNHARVEAILGVDTPWCQLFDKGFQMAYREIFTPPRADGLEAIQQSDAITFHLCGARRELMLQRGISLEELASPSLLWDWDF